MKKSTDRSEVDLYRYGHATFEQIGKEIGTSRQGAKHVYDRAMQKLSRNPALREQWLALFD